MLDVLVGFRVGTLKMHSNNKLLIHRASNLNFHVSKALLMLSKSTRNTKIHTHNCHPCRSVGWLTLLYASCLSTGQHLGRWRWTCAGGVSPFFSLTKNLDDSSSVRFCLSLFCCCCSQVWLFMMVVLLHPLLDREPTTRRSEGLSSAAARCRAVTEHRRHGLKTMNRGGYTVHPACLAPLSCIGCTGEVARDA